MGDTDITAATTNTTARTSRNPAAAAAALVLGAVLVVLAVPRLTAALFALQAVAPLEAAYSPKPPSKAAAAEGLAALVTAFAWHPSSDTATDAASLSMIAGGEENAVSWLTQTLSRSPLRPAEWLSLAERRKAEGDGAGARSALNLSILAGQIEPAIMVRRLTLALALKSEMTPEETAVTRRQTQLTYILRPVAVAEIAQHGPHADFIHAAVVTLTATDYDHIVRIHALH